MLQAKDRGRFSVLVVKDTEPSPVLISSYYNPTQTDETKLTSVDTAAYSYGEGEWKDLLISFGGNAITYDGMGNPRTYGTTEFTWEHGRQLASMTKNNVEWTFTYSNTGLRTSRSNGTTTYKYVYDGSVLKQMTIVSETDKTEKIVGFTYDATGSPLTMTYDGATYYYITNMQGDVVGLLDSAGNRMISYQYTAYGQGYIIGGESSMTAILSTVNPIGYRGYIMDVGTATYYCQSRYYDPAIGRFLNADSIPTTGQGFVGNNMFAYCSNNPVVFSDESGRFLGVLIGAVVGAACGAVSAAIQGKSGSEFWGEVANGAVSGAITGAAADVIALTGGSAAVVIGVSAAASAVGSIAGNVTESAITGELKENASSVDFWLEIGIDAVGDGIMGGVFGLVSGPITSPLKENIGKTTGQIVKKCSRKRLSL